jgi:NADP-dependent 3-hydroxy acid dehydrogenase YdfG
MNTTQQPVAIVTGASSGIGLAVTQALLERGWRVVGTSRTITSSKDLTPSAHLLLVDGDVSKKETALKVVDAALKHFRRIDLLVNNAGIYLLSKAPPSSLARTSEWMEGSMPVAKATVSFEKNITK